MSPQIVGRAVDLLARFDAVVPADGDAMCELFKERGWIEALRYLGERGMLTPAGVAEAGLILAASAEWVDGLETDESPWQVPLPPVPADEPVVVVSDPASTGGRRD
jgi:hypothetical protein